MRLIAALLALLLTAAGLGGPAEPTRTDAGTPHASSSGTPESDPDAPALAEEETPEVVGYDFLPPVVFLEREVALCPLAREYLELPEEAFGEKYPAEALWEQGAFDRLLFTDRFAGPVAAGIAAGDPAERVLEVLGEPQFRVEPFQKNSEGTGPSFGFYTLLGYKTPSFYLAFQIEGKAVRSVCIRKRCPLPEERADILEVLVNSAPWQGMRAPGWERCFGKGAPVAYTQWWRGSLTMICDYGFTSTSGGLGSDTYEVYADFTGKVPRFSRPPDADSDSDSYRDNVIIHSVDYPEELIYNIYHYLDDVYRAASENSGAFSQDGNVFAYAVSGSYLDMTVNGLYEGSHVIVHWMDRSHPDRHVYFGHFSSVIGFIESRWLVESNLFGLHVYDLEAGAVVYSEPDRSDGRSDLRIDAVQRRILDADNHVPYRYSFDAAGDIVIQPQQEEDQEE